ncbi:group II intron reverse transcriptase/maturase [Portibacter marinus]|uniref:group II intron reverse transcriptase/maturase n=1 Tax=Portibacter marinus TaxID=2898660 RepID=UPI001F16A2A0|nr:group II intron reverse transcriptase/maturase [Portibacter marinus]
MNFKEGSKPYPISKEQVWEAFAFVKANGGSSGVDGIDIKTIAANPKKHLYPVWNRLASGSYFPQAVKRVEIPKSDGKVRMLGIPTVKDRVAQTVISKELEQIVEPLFSNSSYGYRPNRNAHQAIEQARKNCWQMPWVIDMDIKGFFDNIDHGLMIRYLRKFTDRKHIITYVKRWLKAPIELKDGTQIQNEEKGTPQGGVISPVLANIFLHVVFDSWMEQEFPDCPFERYADDVIVHVKNEKYARYVLKQIRTRLLANKLELHPDKTQIVYCNRTGRRKRTPAKVRQFDFLGYTFRSRKVKTKDGRVIFGFSPGVSWKSVKRIISTCRKLRFDRWVHMDIKELTKVLSPIIQGWLHYYGRFHKTAMHYVFRIINRRLAKWVFNKYKRFRRRKFVSYAQAWLRKIAAGYPHIFPHWQHGFSP